MRDGEKSLELDFYVRQRGAEFFNDGQMIHARTGTREEKRAARPPRRSPSTRSRQHLFEHAQHIPERANIGEVLVGEAKAGDRILIMGARDDTLIEFARSLVERLAETSSA